TTGWARRKPDVLFCTSANSAQLLAFPYPAGYAADYRPGWLSIDHSHSPAFQADPVAQSVVSLFFISSFLMEAHHVRTATVDRPRFPLSGRLQPITQQGAARLGTSRLGRGAAQRQ